MEIFTGAYTSGKSEISINRALMLKKESFPVTLVDLDTVEPAYTLRPIKKELETYGIKVITQEDYTGLGEAGNVITTDQKNCLLQKGNIVIDVGYGVGGLDILDVITKVEEEEGLEIYIVINASKPETSTAENIIEYVKWSLGSGRQPWKHFNGIISNTHFAEQTEIQDVIRGYELTKQASEALDIPIKAISVSEDIYEQFKSLEYDNISLWPLKRFMPKALW